MFMVRKKEDDRVLRGIEALREKIVPQKKKGLQQAERALKAGLPRAAEGHLRRLLLLPFSIPDEVGGRIGDPEIHQQLIEVSQKIEKTGRARFAGKEPRCQTCKGQCAHQCTRCKGSGYVQQVVPATPENPTGGVNYIRCPTCKGYRVVMCQICSYTGFNLQLLDEGEAKALAEYAKRCVPLIKRDDIEDGLEAAQTLYLRLQITLPDTFLPKDPNTNSLFPLRQRTNIPNRFHLMWDAPKAAVKRMNILMDFGVVAARAMRPYNLLLQYSRTRRLKRDYFKEMVRTVPVPPEWISAFPSFFHDRWISARGIYQGPVDISGFRVLTFLKVTGEAPSDIAFMVWGPRGKNGARTLSEISMGLKRLSTFSYTYPFAGMEAFLKDLTPGREVELFGRFLFQDRGRPRKIFEVWWGGAPGAWDKEEARKEEEKREEKGEDPPPLPAEPTPEPLLSDKEDWILRKDKADRLVREGSGYFRAARVAEGKTGEGEEAFRPYNELSIRLYQKARAFYEKAWAREKAPGVAFLLIQVNRKILERIEAARAR
jgi:hypothetical protein